MAGKPFVGVDEISTAALKVLRRIVVPDWRREEPDLVLKRPPVCWSTD